MWGNVALILRQINTNNNNYTNTGTENRVISTMVCLHLSYQSDTDNWTNILIMFRNAHVTATLINVIHKKNLPYRKTSFCISKDISICHMQSKNVLQTG